jgi:hypothetical protein
MVCGVRGRCWYNLAMKMNADRMTPDAAPVEDLSRGRVARALRAVKAHGATGMLQLLRQHGVSGSVNFVTRNIRHMVADRLARRWDARHHVDTAGSVPLGALKVVGPNRAAGNECVCTSPKTFEHMMTALPAGERAGGLLQGQHQILHRPLAALPRP